MQIKPARSLVMILDTKGRVLTGRDYPGGTLITCIRSRTKACWENEGRRVPVVTLTPGGGRWLEAMAEFRLRCAGSRLDHDYC